MINRRALFSDETIDYKFPYQPESSNDVTVRFRTKKNDAKHVKVVINCTPHEMIRTFCDGVFDYYTYTFRCGEEKVSYYFWIKGEHDSLYYNRLGVVENHEVRHDFSFVPNQKVPEWALGTVYYQIFIDRFCNGDESNDVCTNEYFYTGRHVKKIDDWNKTPETLDVSNFYGGDLQGVKMKLDYLQDLGIETIYFNPLFVSPSNHKYDTQDYDHIDPHFAIIEEDVDHTMQDWEKHNGYAPKYIKRVTSKVNLEKSNKYFADLVKEMHERGMHVIIDGVFNHCGSFNKWMDREGIYLNKSGFEQGAFQSVNSPYRNFFKFNYKPENLEYEGWWGFPTLPKLNYEGCGELVNYILETGKKWVSAPYNVDGWRLDVAADLGHSAEYNHSFWKSFHNKVRQANPEAVVLAEHYGSSREWIYGGEWDTVMNYDAFMNPVTWFLTGMEKHSDAFDGRKYLDGKLFFASMFENMSNFTRPALDAAMNELSNHDHSRFLTRTNRKVGRLHNMGSEAAMDDIDICIMKLAVLIQMTWPGAPAVYYGDEAGQVGWTDPDCRRTYPWGRENRDLLQFHKDAIALHKNIECLKMGSLKSLEMGYGYISYARFDRHQAAIVAINAGNDNLELTLPVWEAGIIKDSPMKRVFATEQQHENGDGKIVDGYIKITLAPRSGCVYAVDKQ